MRKISEKWYRFLRKVLQLLGVSGMALIFQAAYGMREPDYLNGTVVSSATDEPLPNIKVYVRPDWSGQKIIYEAVTDENGMFHYELPGTGGNMIYIIDLEDTDGEENSGSFQDKRVIHYIRDGKNIEVKLDGK